MVIVMSDKMSKEDLIRKIQQSPSGKVWNEDEIKQLLMTNPKAVYNGILAIYKLQTEEEKKSRETQVQNGIGFNANDSVIMSSFAEQILQGKILSQRQFRVASKRILKYVNQLTDIANEDYY
ncbi:hypothetical protein COM61_02200 [Bacillus toyonensis]|nr:hypothetical protein COM61_02200 [Bacillus toyonensis]